jgi:anti-sigma B factor antagonist
MTINQNIRDEVVVLTLSGRLTVETESDVKAMVRQAFDAGRCNIVIDLSGVRYIDSCGLGILAQSYVSAFRRGGAVRLANVTGRNHRLLTITKLLPVFDVFDSVDDAVRSFAGRTQASGTAGGHRPDGAGRTVSDPASRNRSTMAANSTGFSSLG